MQITSGAVLFVLFLLIALALNTEHECIVQCIQTYDANLTQGECKDYRKTCYLKLMR